MIKACLSQSQLLTILINGSPGKEFGTKRDLKQGDPLYSLLFDLGVEGLLVLFQRTSTIAYFRGIEYSHEDYISHLQYTNDTLIFIPTHFHFYCM